MPLDVLQRFDADTTNAILAAAALATAPNAGIDDSANNLIREYQTEINAVLEEIRKKLNIRTGDRSPTANTSVDIFLGRALEESVLAGGRIDDALKRVAQAGRLNPAAYRVIQPETFKQQFYPLSISKPQVEDAIHRPDDLEHLMTDNSVDDEHDIFSLFMKRAGGKGHEPNWLLVQCVRHGIDQVTQAAWRIFPTDVDLSTAQQPLDVLKAFVEKFGVEIAVEGHLGKFIDQTQVRKLASEETVTFNLASHQKERDHSYFWSTSHRQTKDPTIVNVGISYCIDMTVYRQALLAHGASVRRNYGNAP